MSNHVTEWLNAYLDGELADSRFYQVQSHLAECDACLAELDSLENLSDLLQTVPMPEFTSPERFATQVNLRLPHKKTTVANNKILEVGWWMIPVGLLAIWFLLNTSIFVYDVLLAANNVGLLPNAPSWMSFVTSNAADWSFALGRIGLLRGDSLTLATFTETLTRISIPQITLQGSIAILYLSWIAIWWARHAHQVNGQPLEG